MPEEEIEVLLYSDLYDKLTQQQSQKVRVYLERDERYRDILEELRGVEAQTEDLNFGEPSLVEGEKSAEEAGAGCKQGFWMGRPLRLVCNPHILRSVGGGHSTGRASD